MKEILTTPMLALFCLALGGFLAVGSMMIVELFKQIKK